MESTSSVSSLESVTATTTTESTHEPLATEQLAAVVNKFVVDECVTKVKKSTLRSWFEKELGSDHASADNVRRGVHAWQVQAMNLQVMADKLKRSQQETDQWKSLYQEIQLDCLRKECAIRDLTERLSMMNGRYPSHHSHSSRRVSRSDHRADHSSHHRYPHWHHHQPPAFAPVPSSSRNSSTRVAAATEYRAMDKPVMGSSLVPSRVAPAKRPKYLMSGRPVREHAFHESPHDSSALTSTSKGPPYYFTAGSDQI